MERYCLGLDIGGTKCAVSLGRVGGGDIAVLDRRQFPTEKGRPYAVLERFSSVMDEVLRDADLSYADVDGIGISCGGPLNSRTGVVLSPPNLPGWDGIPVCEYFRERTLCRVTLQNDANACAVAEWKYGAGRGAENMVFLTFGTGLGAGLILGGRLYSGASDMAGEIGHVRLRADGPVGYGKAGSAEGFVSGGGLEQLGRMALEDARSRGVRTRLETAERLDAKTLATLAREGDEVARGIFEDCGRHLGETLSLVIDLFNPERIVLGGIYMRCHDLLDENMYAVLRREALPYALDACEILPAGLGERVGDYAALSLATLPDEKEA